jgi:hypothetical protein
MQDEIPGGPVNSNPFALVLDSDGFGHLCGARRVCVTHGKLWLTVDRDPDDHILGAGQCFDLPPGAHALLQAVGGPARATTGPSTMAPATSWLAGLARLRARAAAAARAISS